MKRLYKGVGASVDKRMPLHDPEKSNRFNSSLLPFRAAALWERSIFQQKKHIKGSQQREIKFLLTKHSNHI